jgi:predicted MPP superfamily phosphohydrolase
MPHFEQLLVLLVFAPFLLAGHLALWTMIINRLHATGWSRPLIKTLDKLIYAAVLGLPLLAAYLEFLAPPAHVELFSTSVLGELATFYAFVCLLAILYVALGWQARRILKARVRALRSNDTAVYDVAAALGHRPVQGLLVRLASALPKNEIFKLHVNVKTLSLRGLPAELEGLSILHLSDVHMCGRVTQLYFDYVVERANELDADLVCITGDIVEKTRCLPWLAPTLGRLTARHGKFFVLGNHDKRLSDVPAARRLLVETGLVDLGGRSMMHEVRGAKIFLAGNERPWFGPAPDVPNFHELPLAERAPFRILLSHTPDHIYWAALHGFELMLAGHNHGGQICLPYLGALVSPSYYGVKYASGLFYEPPTLLHVSRGVSGLEPLRFNCPPELTKLVLVSA